MLFLSTSSTFTSYFSLYFRIFRIFPNHPHTTQSFFFRRENIFRVLFLRNTTHLIINTQTMTRFICFPSKKRRKKKFFFLMAGFEMMTMKRRLRSFFSGRKEELIWQTPWRILKIFLMFPNNCSFILKQCLSVVSCGKVYRVMMRKFVYLSQWHLMIISWFAVFFSWITSKGWWWKFLLKATTKRFLIKMKIFLQNIIKGDCELWCDVFAYIIFDWDSHG